uniref:Uncharacterized protein n=1 Tax=Phocoena sinus TaxID=42100 RepID=A0A8C9E0E9_PHOSS
MAPSKASRVARRPSSWRRRARAPRKTGLDVRARTGKVSYLCKLYHNSGLGLRSVWRASGADEPRRSEATSMAAADRRARTLGCQLELETEAKD